MTTPGGVGFRARFRRVGKPPVRPARRPRVSEALYTEILAAMSDTVLITDDTGRFTYVGPNVGEVFGRSARQVLALGNIDALFDSRALAAPQRDPRSRPHGTELELITPSGERRVVSVRVRPVSIDGGTRLYLLP